MGREFGAGDRIQVKDGAMARQRQENGQKTTGLIRQVLDPLLANVQGDRVLSVLFDDGTTDTLARRQVRRIRR